MPEPTAATDSPTIGILGTGSLAAAIVRGLCEGVDDAPPILLSPRGERTSARLAAAYPGVTVAADNQAVVDGADTVLVCLRQDDAGLLGDLTWRPEQTVVSAVAGLTAPALARRWHPRRRWGGRCRSSASRPGRGPRRCARHCLVRWRSSSAPAVCCRWRTTSSSTRSSPRSARWPRSSTTSPRSRASCATTACRPVGPARCWAERRARARPARRRAGAGLRRAAARARPGRGRQRADGDAPGAGRGAGGDARGPGRGLASPDRRRLGVAGRRGCLLAGPVSRPWAPVSSRCC